MKLLYIIPVCFILIGCSTTSQERSIILKQCPTLVNYTPEQQKKAAEELRKLYTDSQLAAMLTDYSKLREACRITAKRVNTNKVKRIR